MSKNLQNKFNFYVEASNLQKGKSDTGKDVVFIEGIASTSSVEDSDQETLYPSGFNLRPFLDNGLVNYNHKGATDANANIGVPVEAKIINGGKDMYVKCMLWPCAQTTGIVTAYEAFEKYGINRKIGFSIEGKATYKDPFNQKRILKADITGLAVTFCPKNKNTLMNIVKGEYEQAFIDPQEDEVKTCPKCDHDQLIKGKCLECGYEEKAMDTAAIAPVTAEDVEHDPTKNFVSNNIITNFGKDLKKSEVFLQIANNFPQTSIADKKSIFSFIEGVSKNLYKMEGGKITKEALQKAFDLLNDASALVKGEQPTTTGTENTDITKGEGGSAIDFDSDEVKKAVELASFLQKGGMSKEDGCDYLTKGGFTAEVAQASWEKALSAAQAVGEGGNVTTQEVPLMKSEDVSVLVNEQLTKATAPINEAISKGFDGLNTIIKSLQEQNEALAEQNTQFLQRIEKLETSPAGQRKSATSAVAVQKFMKSEDAESNPNTYNVAKQEDLDTLSEVLFAKHSEHLEKGEKENAALVEGTINSIEMYKTVPQYAYKYLHARGITLVAPN